jgi:hypothetical protein
VAPGEAGVYIPDDDCLRVPQPQVRGATFVPVGHSSRHTGADTPKHVPAAILPRFSAFRGLFLARCDCTGGQNRIHRCPGQLDLGGLAAAPGAPQHRRTGSEGSGEQRLGCLPRKAANERQAGRCALRKREAVRVRIRSDRRSRSNAVPEVVRTRPGKLRCFSSVRITSSMDRTSLHFLKCARPWPHTSVVLPWI